MDTDKVPDSGRGSGPGDGPDAGERSRQLIGLLAEENRLRAFAAVALGARSTRQVAETAGLTPKDTALALLRLREQGAVTDGPEDGLAVAHDLLRELARPRRTEGSARPAAGDAVSTFVRDGRLLRLPAQWTRKQQVLRHIAERTFEPGVAYPERVVNERLRAWCEGTDEIDHVTLRRYLVDLHELRRSEGVYERVRPQPA
ncbi:DUF2087 domain-containing protein [Streptomyces olivaceoviridis]